MDFIIPKTLNYYLEPGWYTATLANISYDPEAKGSMCSCEEKARFTFHLDGNPRSIQQDSAARTFCMGEHSEDLFDFLKRWLGSELMSFVKDNGALDLDKLTGRRALIQIVHKAGSKEKYARPFCKIAGIRALREDTGDEEAA